MVITNTTTQPLLVAISNTISVVVSVAMLVCWQWPGVVVMLGADVPDKQHQDKDFTPPAPEVTYHSPSSRTILLLLLLLQFTTPKY